MTGTAQGSEKEFREAYELEVVTIPTRLPPRRVFPIDISSIKRRNGGRRSSKSSRFRSAAGPSSLVRERFKPVKR